MGPVTGSLQKTDTDDVTGADWPLIVELPVANVWKNPVSILSIQEINQNPKSTNRKKLIQLLWINLQ